MFIARDAKAEGPHSLLFSYRDDGDDEALPDGCGDGKSNGRPESDWASCVDERQKCRASGVIVGSSGKGVDRCSAENQVEWDHMSGGHPL